MSNRQRYMTATLLALLTPVLAGCGFSFHLDDPVNTAARPADVPVDTATAGATDAEAPTSEVTFHNEPTPSSGTRATIVGLYGELVSDAVDASSPGDGASNIMRVTFASEGADFDPDVDNSGKWILFASTQHRHTADIYLKSVNGSTLTQLTSDPADDVMPKFSPDAKQVAFASRRSGNWDIYTMPVTGGNAVQVTDDTSHDVHPTWSPDGRRLAFSKFGEQSQRWELWVVDLQNPSVKHFVDYGLFPQWSPDPAQSKILFQRARQRGSRYHSVWTIDFVDGEGRSPTEIVSAANAATISPAWAPDGQHIVFATVVEPERGDSESPAVSDLWIINIDGTGRTNLTNGDVADYQPTWGADGRIYFVSNRSGNDNLWAVAPTWLQTTPKTPGDAGSSVATVPENPDAGN